MNNKKGYSKNSFLYNGIVNVTIKKSGRVIMKQSIHNKGQNTLFKTFSRLLCGDNDALNDIPFSIDAGVYKADEFSNYVFTSVLSSPSVITRHTPVYNTTSKKWTAEFVSTIIYSQVVDSTEAISSLALRNSSGEILALVEQLDSDVRIDESSTLIVQWNMYFDNNSTRAIE